MALLDREGWQSNADSGWDEFDVTIYGDRFTKAIVKTVAENHGGEKRLLRGQLTASWTLFARTSLCIVTALAVVTARLLWAFLLPMEGVPWWMLWLAGASVLVVIPVWAFYLHHRAARTLRLTTALLDLTAQAMNLIKLKAAKKFEKPA